MTGASFKRAAERLSVLTGLADTGLTGTGLVITGLSTMLVLMLFASTAMAEQPTDSLRLRDSDRSAAQADNFDLTSPADTRFGDQQLLSASGRHSAMVEDINAQHSPRWPSASDNTSQMNPPVVLDYDTGRRSDTANLAWGLTGTGASIFTGALLFHLETLQLRGESDQTSNTVSAEHYRDVNNQLDQTRKIIVALYAVGGSMVTGGVVLLANKNHNGTGIQAKLAPAWMNGAPAARLKVRF